MSKKIDSKKLPRIKVTVADGVETAPHKAEPAPAPSPKISVATSTKAKETVYVDVDDEITAIIEKVTSSKSEIVALVLPKRAAVLQSVVNMKLLKRSADRSDKNLVLVTTEATILPLAGMVGLHVASTPTGKPSVPAAPRMPSDEPEQVEEPVETSEEATDADEEMGEDFNQEAVASTPIGVLAGANDDETESVELPDEDEDLDSQGKPNVTPVAKQKRDNKLAVPNFDSFRNKLLLGFLGLVLLGGLYYLMFYVMPRTTITIESETSTVESNFSMTLDTKELTVDEVKRVVPATVQTVNKSGTQAAPATGQQNNGEKASGTVKFSTTLCAPNLGNAPNDIPTGSGVTGDGKTYITQEGGSYSFTGLVSGSCMKYTTNAIDIVALKGGSTYNIGSGTAFSGPGGASGSGSASGGTDSIVKVVAQADIDGAKAKIAAQNTDLIKQELTAALKAKGLMAIPATFKAGEEQVNSSAKAGDKADTVTVTTNTVYTLFGVKKEDVKSLVLVNVKKQIDEDKQKVLQDGIDTAQFSLEGEAGATSATVGVKVKSVAGPFIEIAEVKQKAAGKKEASIRGDLQDIPGVTNVEVHYSPFWVSKAPKDVNKITVEVGKVSN